MKHKTCLGIFIVTKPNIPDRKMKFKREELMPHNLKQNPALIHITHNCQGRCGRDLWDPVPFN